MQIKKKSGFRNPEADVEWFNEWATWLEKLNGKKYTRIEIQTSLGKTHVWGLNVEKQDLETIVIFPGARTTPLFWDLDNGLKSLEEKCRIFLVETNGLPNNSDGNTPDINSLGYGEWASEVLEMLNIDTTYVAGASFGGLICMKLCIVAPQKVKEVFLLNPGCLQPFSLTFKNLYYNILPILFPSKENVTKFLDIAVFCEPNHSLSKEMKALVVDYEVFALTRYNDNTQKPYYMNDELKKVKSIVHLIEGDKDLLFPYKKSIKNAREKLVHIEDIIVCHNVGHGIETYPPAIQAISERIS
ncbi:MAG TPA: alpha/beta fold hydrolase [Cyclobacteriaceae bacterium]